MSKDRSPPTPFSSTMGTRPDILRTGPCDDNFGNMDGLETLRSVTDAALGNLDISMVSAVTHKYRIHNIYKRRRY